MAHFLPDQFVLVSFLGIVAWAAARDAAEFAIPDAASLAIAGLYPAHVLASPLPINWLGALVAAVAVFVCSFFLFARGYVGGGDVKLLTATSLWAGPQFILPLLLTMGLAGGVLATLIWGRYRLFALLEPAEISGAAVAKLPLRLPYGIAIATGASLVGLRLLMG